MTDLLGRFMEQAYSLFIHHDVDSQPWVEPYLCRRFQILSTHIHYQYIGSGMKSAFDDAKYYFGIERSEYPHPTVMSDWIRCHMLLLTPRMLYSDSDVLWISEPELGENPLKGDTTFGIMWSGSGLSEEAKAYAFMYAKECGMQKNINSNFLIPIGDRMDNSTFYHGKPDSNPELVKSILGFLP